jgi:hypothetical protein
VTDGTGSEQGSNTLVFTLTRTLNSFTQIVVGLNWTGTAVFGTDYTVSVSGGTLSANGQQLTLASGQTTATITVTPIDDTLLESTEGVTLSISNGAAYTVGTPSSGSGTIADDDTPATVTLATTDSGGAEQALNPMVFTVNRTINTAHKL